MSDIMRPIPFENLVKWIVKEKKERGTIFGVQKWYEKESNKTLPLFGTNLETPVGPAAGPHTQLAQNIIAAYVAGSRFFELKTVQIMDGAELSACVKKPCIDARDECYNTEWSTELYVQEAYDEYVKAWFAIKLLAKEYGFGDPDGFIFNMSVGYDFDGITSPKIDKYMEEMMEAKDTPIFQTCKEFAFNHLDLFEHVDADYINAISSKVSNSITLSTLHGCPPQEIEKIASYLIDTKHLNTFIKCNPTLLGYDRARAILDEMGFDYVQFGKFHFEDDLQYEDAIPMLERLLKLADQNKVEFGVKITNTFPVDNPKDYLPIADEMYMSGRSLFPCSLKTAQMLSENFKGQLKISYSGGADAFNIAALFDTGIWPITVATTVLKPGGYGRIVQLVNEVEKKEWKAFTGIDLEKLGALEEQTKSDAHHIKAIKPAPKRKMNAQVPLTDCFKAPCKEGCPIHQDIPSYIALMEAGKAEEAFEVILDKNALPFITGTICPHRCMSKCTRNFYEESVKIRAVKLEAAKAAYDSYMKKHPAKVLDEKASVAIVGAGPAGLSAAYFLGRNGVKSVIFEKEEKAGGIVSNVIPEFRISMTDIEKDIALVKHMGADIQTGCEITDWKQLKEMGFDTVIFAVGASKHGSMGISSDNVINVIDFLKMSKANDNTAALGSDVIIIGGGNTAMDAARVAKRTKGVEKVSIVYRRTKRYMPADEEELELAIEEGVQFVELAAPEEVKDGMLICEQMELGAPDASGRRSPVGTGKKISIKADTVISAIGEKVDTAYFEAFGLEVQKGSVMTNEQGVYVAGDASRGPATVVEAIADARKITDLILEEKSKQYETVIVKEMHSEDEVRAKRAVLHMAEETCKEGKRCLECNLVCECCVDACPNRANISVKTADGKCQIVHMDGMCNECGNCKTFCPYDSAPYLDKFTYFNDEKDFADSKNQGFTVIDQENEIVKIRLGGQEKEFSMKEKDLPLTKELELIIFAFLHEYSYLLAK